MHEESKKLLRQSLIQTRKSRSEQIFSYASFEVLFHNKILMAIEKIDTIYSTKINNIAFYWPIHGELDLRNPLLNWQKQSINRQLALPVTKKNQALEFFSWQESVLMRPGYANIPEPIDSQRIIPDLIICPCVGWYFFAHKIWRIGYGGGFYDRTMNSFADKVAKPFLLGIALEELQVTSPNWQPHEYDFPLDGLLTESLILFIIMKLF
jgi:5,10-methenyltetrahydrofolate synthetase